METSPTSITFPSILDSRLSLLLYRCSGPSLQTHPIGPSSVRIRGSDSRVQGRLVPPWAHTFPPGPPVPLNRLDFLGEDTSVLTISSLGVGVGVGEPC